MKERLLSFGVENICMSEISASELLYGARDKKHFTVLRKFIDQSLTLPITREISNLHFKLVAEYSLSRKLKVQDALIAATAMTLSIDFYTLNVKDFKFIKGIRLI